MKYLFKENEIVGSLLLKKLHDTCTCILIYYSFISYNQYKSFIYTFQPLPHKRTLGMQNTVLSPQAYQDYVLFSCKNITTILSLSSELKLCRFSILSFVQCYLLITVTFKIMWNEKLYKQLTCLDCHHYFKTQYQHLLVDAVTLKIQGNLQRCHILSSHNFDSHYNTTFLPFDKSTLDALGSTCVIIFFLFLFHLCHALFLYHQQDGLFL